MNILNRVKTIFKRQAEMPIIESTEPEFDKKYKTILTFPVSTHYMDKIFWVNDNSGSGSVDVQIKDDTVYMAFEHNDDVVSFKIKFMRDNI